jgi:hypothetical protein
MIFIQPCSVGRECVEHNVVCLHVAEHVQTERMRIEAVRRENERLRVRGIMPDAVGEQKRLEVVEPRVPPLGTTESAIGRHPDGNAFLRVLKRSRNARVLVDAGRLSHKKVGQHTAIMRRHEQQSTDTVFTQKSNTPRTCRWRT